MFRNLWEHIGKKLPKKNVAAAGQILSIHKAFRPQLVTALSGTLRTLCADIPRLDRCRHPCTPVLHHRLLQYCYVEAGIRCPSSSGYMRLRRSMVLQRSINGRFDLFRNYSVHGEPLDRPNTLLIGQRTT